MDSWSTSRILDFRLDFLVAQHELVQCLQFHLWWVHGFSISLECMLWYLIHFSDCFCSHFILHSRWNQWVWIRLIRLVICCPTEFNAQIVVLNSVSKLGLGVHWFRLQYKHFSRLKAPQTVYWTENLFELLFSPMGEISHIPRVVYQISCLVLIYCVTILSEQILYGCLGVHVNLGELKHLEEIQA